MKFLLTISMLAGFISCSDLRKSEQLERIDAINVTLTEMKGELAATDIAELKVMKENAQALMLEVKSQLHDTIPLSFALALDAHKKMTKTIGPLFDDYTELEERLKADLSTIDNLRKDVAEGNGKRHEYDENIDFEEEKAMMLNEAIEKFVLKRNEVDSIYTTWQETLKNHINERSWTLEVQ